MKTIIAFLALLLCACQSNKLNYTVTTVPVRTTAYCHLERDSLPYGKKNAIGTNLLYGKTRSAASDWSFMPVGTEFRIKGLPNLFVIDDYGSALVGKKTIDLYFPTKKLMRAWGTRHVEIEIVKMGSFEKSREILTPRRQYAHIRKMLVGLN